MSDLIGTRAKQRASEWAKQRALSVCRKGPPGGPFSLDTQRKSLSRSKGLFANVRQCKSLISSRMKTLEKKPSMRLSQEPCVGVKVNSKRCAGCDVYLLRGRGCNPPRLPISGRITEFALQGGDRAINSAFTPARQPGERCARSSDANSRNVTTRAPAYRLVERVAIRLALN